MPAAIRDPVMSDPPLEKVQIWLSSVTPKNPGITRTSLYRHKFSILS